MASSSYYRTLISESEAKIKELEGKIERLNTAKGKASSLLGNVTSYKGIIENHLADIAPFGSTDWEGDTVKTFEQKFLQSYNTMGKVVTDHETICLEIDAKITELHNSVVTEQTRLHNLRNRLSQAISEENAAAEKARKEAEEAAKKNDKTSK